VTRSTGQSRVDNERLRGAAIAGDSIFLIRSRIMCLTPPNGHILHLTEDREPPSPSDGIGQLQCVFKTHFGIWGTRWR
jgi:hypothetical protein